MARWGKSLPHFLGAWLRIRRGGDLNRGEDKGPRRLGATWRIFPARVLESIQGQLPGSSPRIFDGESMSSLTCYSSASSCLFGGSFGKAVGSAWGEFGWGVVVGLRSGTRAELGAIEGVKRSSYPHESGGQTCERGRRSHAFRQVGVFCAVMHFTFVRVANTLRQVSECIGRPDKG